MLKNTYVPLKRKRERKKNGIMKNVKEKRDKGWKKIRKNMLKGGRKVKLEL